MAPILRRPTSSSFVRDGFHFCGRWPEHDLADLGTGLAGADRLDRFDGVAVGFGYETRSVAGRDAIMFVDLLLAVLMGFEAATLAALDACRVRKWRSQLDIRGGRTTLCIGRVAGSSIAGSARAVRRHRPPINGRSIVGGPPPTRNVPGAACSLSSPPLLRRAGIIGLLSRAGEDRDERCHLSITAPATCTRRGRRSMRASRTMPGSAEVSCVTRDPEVVFRADRNRAARRRCLRRLPARLSISLDGMLKR